MPFCTEGLRLVQLVKTAREHERFIEYLGDEIRLTLGFGIYLRPSYCFLAHMQSPVSGLASLLSEHKLDNTPGHLRRFDEAIARFADKNFIATFSTDVAILLL